MFEITTADVDMLKNSIGIVAEIIDEGIFRISKSGLKFVAADRALVAVVDLSIATAAFEKFEVTEDTSVGVNMNNFVSVLRRASAGDKLTLKKEDGKNRLKVIIAGASTRRFEVPIIDMVESELPPTDKLEFSSSVELKSDVLAEGIADAEIISDIVIFEASSEGFKIRSEGDSSITELELEKGNPSLVKLELTNNTKSGYPLDYLKKMVKATKLADTAGIKFSSDFPMKMEFGSGDKFKMSFVLAPHMIE
ncbi:MAG: proliferating cell nuclear antigen (pcna) [Candidatus Aenigmarchaeota archaeon]|nr:proliferating cell nuclear antigen (pcna) [Candidatus Aenigmarchaeota archaeon]